MAAAEELRAIEAELLLNERRIETDEYRAGRWPLANDEIECPRCGGTLMADWHPGTRGRRVRTCNTYWCRWTFVTEDGIIVDAYRDQRVW
jgi:ribosomal protein S27AE